jgi:hypothetical protein
MLFVAFRALQLSRVIVVALLALHARLDFRVAIEAIVPERGFAKIVAFGTTAYAFETLVLFYPFIAIKISMCIQEIP